MISRKKHIIVDFNGYNLPDAYAIKEFSALVAKRPTRTPEDNFKLLVLSPYEFDQLPQGYKVKFVDFYERHGIDWERGDTVFNDVARILKNYFQNSKYIYVRNAKKKKILEMFIGKRDDIQCLEDLGFRGKFDNLTFCANHESQNSNCAIDNSKAMLVWLEQSMASRNSNRMKENRVFIQVEIKDHVFNALLDTGSTATCIRSFEDFMIGAAGVSKSERKSATGPDGHVMQIKSSIRLPLVIDQQMLKLDVRIVPKLGYEMVLGIDAVRAFGIGLDGASRSWWTKRSPKVFKWN